jgi:preprotein translocase SecE subunit
MALHIYKPGQGYWMRVVTAAMLGILTLATASWVALEARQVAENLPKNSYVAKVDTSTLTGLPVASDRVELLGKAAGNDRNRPVLGTADIAKYDAQEKTVVLTKVEMSSADVDPSQAEFIRSPQGSSHVFSVSVDKPRGTAAIEPLYIQGGAAMIVIVIGALLALWLTGMNPKSVEFLIATDMEMKKVNWSTRRDVIASTWVVIGAAFLISALLFVFDLVLQKFFQLIGVLV